MIRLENVSKAFGGRRVLSGYDLHVEKGETFVIIGPSGIGKSVTLKHIVGLLTPDEGRIIVDGVDIVGGSAADLAAVRKRIGYLFQGGALINWMSVGENVELPLRENRKRKLSRDEIARISREKLAMVNMASERHKYPDAISGGMRKRVAVARVLVQDPSIILYDEPTAGLDPRMSATITNLIRDVKKRFGVTSIVVTHDLPLAYAVGDRIGMMHLGKLVEVGTPDQLRASKNPIVRDFIEGRPILSVDEETKLGMYLP